MRGRHPYNWGRDHPLVVDGLLAVLLAVLGIATEAATPPEDVVREADGFSAVLSLVATLPLVLRRRHPLVAFGIIAAASAVYFYLEYPGGGPALGWIFALYGVAAYLSRRTAVYCLVATLTFLGFGILDTEDSASVIEIVGVGAVFSAGWVMGDSMRVRRAYVAAVEDRAVQLEREQDAQARRAVLEERTRIARELHDVVAHSMSVMVVQAGAARRMLDRDRDRAVEAIGQIEATGRGAMAEMRRLVGVLRGDLDRLDGPDGAPRPEGADGPAGVAEPEGMADAASGEGARPAGRPGRPRRLRRRRRGEAGEANGRGEAGDAGRVGPAGRAGEVGPGPTDGPARHHRGGAGPDLPPGAGGGPALLPQPDIEQLPALVDQCRDAGLEVVLHVDGPVRTLPSGIELVVYRIVQEALTNTMRHAGPAARADVELVYGERVVTVTVTDDGRGAAADTAIAAGGRAEPGATSGRGRRGERPGRERDEDRDRRGGDDAAGPRPGGPSPSAQMALLTTADQGVVPVALLGGRGHGLTGMHERVALYGGRITAGPRAGGGFRVWAEIPLDADDGSVGGSIGDGP